MSTRQTKRRDAPMSTSLITEAQNAILEIGGDWPRDMKRPEWISQAARRANLTKSAVERILYGKRKRLYADEYLTLQEKLAALQERRAKNEAAYGELTERAVSRGCLNPAERDGGVDGHREPRADGSRVAHGSADEAAAARRSDVAGPDEG